jgi:GGDEF domain-containing protein
MLGCVDAAIQRVARAEGATFIRAGENELAVVAPGREPCAAEALAELGRSTVEALQIRAEHPRIATKGVVTVSAAVLSLGSHASIALEDRVKGAVYEAKRRGRNCVFVERASDP